ncbi:hypothetical protein ACO3_270003 [Thiomonas arsenitoxydans]|nr:hypothetical protein ACO3_270003 [Thiomonas arsenitoxydans]
MRQHSLNARSQCWNNRCWAPAPATSDGGFCPLLFNGLPQDAAIRILERRGAYRLELASCGSIRETN